MNWLPWSEALGLVDLPAGYSLQALRSEHLDAVTAALP